MTKQYFTELADYNSWATERFCGFMEALTDEQWAKEVVSSFNSIQLTTLHLISAETAWLDRLNKVEVRWLQSTFKGSKAAHLNLWKASSANLKKFIEAFNEEKLQSNLDFKRLNGDAYSMPYYQVFAHLFNHGTYHRGQLVTLLRQVGFTGIQPTDLLAFYR